MFTICLLFGDFSLEFVLIIDIRIRGPCFFDLCQVFELVFIL